ncbi:hypothetical protein OsJ_11171 [Oryza sativa Japonica Group]|uniref:Beta-glucosidase-aggregating factor n=2 Tax=Oryza sativa subsp. japonica TaxID=39947 RepID=A3AIU5_ORYSJ|nr:putative beta-glucosidase-aggregating factor [Oryza sativa Japonica Group]ABF96453.1 hypothetical protein LOC_Os03g28170 [Oryza sativa Japonica Group]EAZ27234.1 hypothetical protein OsJ_11171 [Oryza sativa Japonica Group]
MAGSLVKLGAWGGDHGGKEYDVTVAPQRLEGFWLRYGKVIDCISSPTSTRTRTSTPSAPGAAKAASPNHVRAIGVREGGARLVGPIGDYTHVVTSLKLVTSQRTIGPFGNGAGTPFAVPVLNNGSVVGFFARAGPYLESIGIYVHPF